MASYDPEERGHRRGTCRRCGYRGWSDDSGECPNPQCGRDQDPSRDVADVGEDEA